MEKEPLGILFSGKKLRSVHKYADFKSPESRALPIILKSEINKIWSGQR